jgi:hypothetical protein
MTDLTDTGRASGLTGAHSLAGPPEPQLYRWLPKPPATWAVPQSQQTLACLSR